MNRVLRFCCVLLLCILCVPTSGLGSTTQEKPVIKSGWFPLDPYQYLERGEGFERLSGLDIKLVAAIARNAGYSIKYDEVTWRQHQNDLRTGVRDMASGATKTPEREEFVYFSIPYREESNAIFYLKTAPYKIKFTSVPELIQKIRAKNIKIGVIDGFVYVDPLINKFIDDPANKDLIVRVENTSQSLANLRDGRVQAILSDRIDAATSAWRVGFHEEIEQRYIGSVPIHLMFSKKSVTPEVVAKFNQAITDLKNSKEYSDIFKIYLFPLLLMQTTDKTWFFIIDMMGTIAFAISGILIAYQMRASLFTTLVMAALPAVGGGMIRDVIVGRKPLGVLQSPYYILAILGTVLISYLLIRALPRFFPRHNGHVETEPPRAFRLTLEVFDALGLAAFTVIGANVAVIARCDPLWLWGPLLAAITGAGGGILRDFLRPDRHISALTGEFYAEVALIWGLFLSLVITWTQDRISPEQILFVIVFTMIGTFLTRILAVWMRLRGPQFTR